MGVNVLGRIGMQYKLVDCFCIQGIVWVRILDWRVEIFGGKANGIAYGVNSLTLVEVEKEVEAVQGPALP